MAASWMRNVKVLGLAEAIQALDRKDRMLPLSPGRAESHGFEYKRNGTLSLFAALNTATGEVLGKTAPRHTSEQFVAFPIHVYTFAWGKRGSRAPRV